jgi:hypothetical protein
LLGQREITAQISFAYTWGNVAGAVAVSANSQPKNFQEIADKVMGGIELSEAAHCEKHTAIVAQSAK